MRRRLSLHRLDQIEIERARLSFFQRFAKFGQLGDTDSHALLRSLHVTGLGCEENPQVTGRLALVRRQSEPDAFGALAPLPHLENDDRLSKRINCVGAEFRIDRYIHWPLPHDQAAVRGFITGRLFSHALSSSIVMRVALPTFRAFRRPSFSSM